MYFYTGDHSAQIAGVHISNGHFDGCTKRITISLEMFDIGNQ